MNIFLRRLSITLLGLFGGLAAWPLTELIIAQQHLFDSYLLFSMTQGALIGIVLGFFFGSGEGLSRQERRKMLSGGASGALLGLMGGVLGCLTGQVLMLFLLEALGTRGVLFARIPGWVVLGLSVGMSEGIRARSGKKILIGVLGGVIGGGLGGASIDLLPLYFPSIAALRAVGFVLLGSSIAFCYALLEKSVSPGILRILNGRQRGQEYAVAQNRLRVGRGKGNDIVLNTYEDVKHRHALFRLKKEGLWIEGSNGENDVLVNDIQISGPKLLKYEDCIRLGSAKLYFRAE